MPTATAATSVPHDPRHHAGVCSRYRGGLATFSLLAMLVTAGCRRDPGALQGPTTGNARGEDAAGLPAFGSEGEAIGETERFKVEVGDAPVRGNPNALVTVVMFSDFECGFCRQGYHTLRELEHRYEGRVRIAYKAFPLDFHSAALPTAIAARTAQSQGKFWEFHDRLFSDQRLDLERLFDYARDAGMDTEALAKDLDALAWGPEVRRDMRQARKLGVSSTPTFFINGRMISGARPIGEMSSIVDEELELADTWLAQGVAPSDLYAHAINGGYSAVQYTERRGLDPDGVFVVPLGKSPAIGPATAPVTIVAFGDFECPFCARGNDVISRLRARYGEKIRLVHKHNPLPFHSHAFVAARAAAAADAQGKFWPFHDALYETRAHFDEDTLDTIAKRIGLDMKRFRRDMAGRELDQVVDDDLALGAMLGVTGTPAYFVNGRPIEGALPELHFRLVIEEELERAATALERGVEPAKLYDTLCRTPIE
ncbi:MAG: thioredoxin domain-containing protein [Deltaproteobacteria bacterium]|nr:thioredoxin domain-containing protein [Deltaproteobacteria bacterium]